MERTGELWQRFSDLSCPFSASLAQSWNRACASQITPSGTSLEQHISNWPKSLSLPCPAPAGVPEKTSWAIAFQDVLEVQPLKRVGITTHRKTPGQRFSRCPVAERWHGREGQALPICQGSNHYQLNPGGLTRFHFNPRLKYPQKCLIKIDKM